MGILINELINGEIYPLKNLENMLEFFRKPYTKKGFKKASYNCSMIYEKSSSENFSLMWSEFFKKQGFSDERYIDGCEALHLVCKKWGKTYPLATISFNYNKDIVTIKQIQSVSCDKYQRIYKITDSEKLCFLRQKIAQNYWSYSLLATIVDLAIKKFVCEVRVQPKSESYWTNVKQSNFYFRTYDFTAIDFGFKPIRNGKKCKIKIENEKIVNNVDFYSLKTKKLELHPELLKLGIKCPNFDIKNLHRR